jgi:hypothetical protein
MNSINAALLANADVSLLIPCCNWCVHQRISPGARNATAAIRITIEMKDNSSWLCGVWPSVLALESVFGVGCSVLSAAGLSATVCTPNDLSVG